MPLTALAAILMLAAAARGAPSAEEQRLYAEGLAAWNVGDARAAERAWAKGYEVARDPAFLVRMGEAEEKAGAPVEAYETYRRYLREAPDASDRADIEQRIVRLAPAGRPPPPEAKREGADEQPGEFGAAAPASPPTAAPRAGAVDAEAATKPTAEGDSGWNRYNVTAMSTAGASLLLLGTAAFFAAEASSKESDIARLQTARDDTTGTPIPYSSVAGQYESALADGRRDAHDARLALVGAAGAATISAVFFVLDAHFTREASVALAPSARGGGFAAATWRF